MRRPLLLGLLALLLSGGLAAQGPEAQQLLLNVEKLAQLRQLLGDMKQGYEVLRSGYGVIRDVSEGNFSLHQGYLDGLLQVSPAVRHYRRVAEILRLQALLAREYRQAYDRFRRQGQFSPAELDYLAGVYGRLLRQSLESLEALTLVLTATPLRMTDAERLQAIDAIHRDVQDGLLFLRHFNHGTSLLALQRAREKKDLAMRRTLYGIPD